MITDHDNLEEWETAFANLRAKQDIKALIHPNGRIEGQRPAAEVGDESSIR